MNKKIFFSLFFLLFSFSFVFFLLLLLNFGPSFSSSFLPADTSFWWSNKERPNWGFLGDGALTLDNLRLMTDRPKSYITQKTGLLLWRRHQCYLLAFVVFSSFQRKFLRLSVCPNVHVISREGNLWTKRAAIKRTTRTELQGPNFSNSDSLCLFFLAYHLAYHLALPNKVPLFPSSPPKSFRHFLVIQRSNSLSIFIFFSALLHHVVTRAKRLRHHSHNHRYLPLPRTAPKNHRHAPPPRIPPSTTALPCSAVTHHCHASPPSTNRSTIPKNRRSALHHSHPPPPPQRHLFYSLFL